MSALAIAPAAGSPWIQTASGRAFDLLTPSAADVDFVRDVAPALARLPRFGGHAGPYSVAQHCVLGADAMLEETGRTDYALAFLLHDAHEAYIGDMTTPVQLAIVAALAGLQFGAHAKADVAGQFKAAMRHLKTGIDHAVWLAAGLNHAAFCPGTPGDRALKQMDLRMLDTERRQLLGVCRSPWDLDRMTIEPVRLKGRIRCKPWPEAADEWLERLWAWAPNARPRP